MIFFSEFRKGLVMNKTNLRAFFDIFGTNDVESWKGQKAVLFNDESVSFQGRRTGGLRVRRLSDAESMEAEAKAAF